MDRVLIANRGEIARRLVRFYREHDIESVVVFSEPDADAPWCDEADYPVYLNGHTVAETYLDPRRVLSAAFDSGSDAIHPGYCFLAEHVGFHGMAAQNNMPVLGPPGQVLARVRNRQTLRAVATELGIPLVPASDPLDDDDDGLRAGSRIGTPLYVKGLHGGPVRRVEDLGELPRAVAAVRGAALLLTGEPRVYLEPAIDVMRQCGTLVVGDHGGAQAFLGTTDSSLQLGSHTWVEEMGDEVVSPAYHDTLGEAAMALARALDWEGVGHVRWVLVPDGHMYLLGFSARLTTGYSLVEQLFDVDLLHTQHRVVTGDDLTWEGSETRPGRHGLQLRLLHLDPDDGVSRPEGVLERLDVPDGVHVELGVEPGFRCTAHTEPLLAKLTVTAPTRHAALVRARAAVEALRVEGVPTNRDLLLELLGREDVWRQEHHTRTARQLFHRD